MLGARKINHSNARLPWFQWVEPGDHAAWVRSGSRSLKTIRDQQIAGKRIALGSAFTSV
jgi:hypothetical protein